MPQNRRESFTAFSAGGSTSSQIIPRFLGSGIAGISELLLFHPVDTVAKRLMSNTSTKVTSLTALNTVVFKSSANASFFSKYASLFPGFGFAAGYKVLQRIYKFGGQPFARDAIDRSFGDKLQSTFGRSTGKTLSASFAGSLMGIFEIILLPLDVLKIKSQTNPETLQGRGLVDLITKDFKSLYKGGTWTALRNAPGSFALFGGSAFVHHGVFGLENTKDATWTENFVASMVGAICSITVAAPLDVVKTRLQNKAFGAKETGFDVISKLVKEEGVTAFFKGLTPKIIVVGPKLIFSFTVAQTMISYFEKSINEK